MHLNTPQNQARTATSRERLTELSRHRDKAVRTAVASNPACPPDLLQILVADKHHLVRFAVAQRDDSTGWRIALEAADPYVREILAQHPDLDDDTLDALLADPERKVRESLATSTRRPDILERLSRDDNKDVRASTALNDALADETLKRLATDPIAQVRACVAQRLRLDHDDVSRLARDRSANVRYFILETHPERLDIAQELVRDGDRDIRQLAMRLLSRDL